MRSFIVSMSVKPPWSPLGQPAEGLMIACGVLLGELLGFTWAAQQTRARTQSREQAAALLNHAAKRVISGSAHSSQLVLGLLDALTCDDEAARMRARDEAEDLLRTQWTSSIIGFHACRQALREMALVQSSPNAGIVSSWARTSAERDEVFPVGDLLARVFRPAGGFDLRVNAPAAELAANRPLLEAVLLQAIQNARTHGAAGAKISVAATLDAGRLRVAVENAAGPNHARLLRLGTADLFAADRGRNLVSAGVGTVGSTYMGLRDMQLAAAAHDPPAELTLTVLPAAVRFVLELRVDGRRLAARRRNSVGSPAAAAGAHLGRGAPCPPPLPEGLCFVFVDDDKIARLLAKKHIAQFRPHERSVVLGETRTETALVPERVSALGTELGAERVITILDQNMNYVDGDVFGTDICRILRQDFAWEGAILILSANCEASDERDYLHAGADGALEKGVSAASQMNALAQVYRRRFPDKACSAMRNHANNKEC